MRGWVAAARWRARWAGWPRLLYAGTALSLVLTAAQMVRDHPLQNVYFNLLAGPNVAQRFEMDYWCLGYRQDLAYIVAHDPRPLITVFAPPPNSAELNSQLLPPAQRARLRFVEQPENADYFITNYRNPSYRNYLYPFQVHEIRVDGRRVHSVFQRTQ
ncbi:MAG: hypothetical protein EOO59_13900 [Hymenobacter sp.]|nr:MAG: hypothetical protein EOO59_13900 [Hymenobacter sp.]